MDKNMIHIDDLVRQRLTGGEEEDRAGAWLKMRDLLDKEMPTEKVVAGFGWKRGAGIAALLLLAGSAVLGGYKFLNRSTTGGGENKIAVATNVPKQNTASKTTTIADKPNLNNNPTTVANAAVATKTSASNIGLVKTEHQTTTSSSQIISTEKTNTSSTSGHRSGIRAVASKIKNNSNVASAKTISSSENSTNQQSHTPSGNNSVVANTTVAAQKQDVSSTKTIVPAGSISTPTIAANQPKVDSKTIATSTADVAKTQNGIVENSKTNSIPSSPAALNVVSASTSNVKPVNNAPKMVIQKDTINKIVMNEHRVVDAETRSVKFKMDTVSTGKIVVNKLVPAPTPSLNPTPATLTVAKAKAPIEAKPKGPALAMANSKPTVVPQAQIDPIASPAQTTLVLLADHKVSTQSGLGIWNADKLQSMADDVKFKLAQIHFYPGIIAGINASILSANSLGGFQLGMTGLFTITERLSAVAELKYIMRFNTGSTLRDDYTTVTDVRNDGQTIYNGKTYVRYTWNADPVDHYINFSTIHSLEMPLMARYELSRFYLQGGMNLSYAFGVGADEITKTHPSASQTALFPLDLTPANGLGPTSASITKNDFDGRFGLGYVFGMGYSFSPAVKVDLRMTQTFWDNASTEGAKKVSTELYHLPSLQLSIGYRFKQNSK